MYYLTIKVKKLSSYVKFSTTLLPETDVTNQIKLN